jgi:hypothetical protein
MIGECFRGGRSSCFQHRARLCTAYLTWFQGSTEPEPEVLNQRIQTLTNLANTQYLPSDVLFILIINKICAFSLALSLEASTLRRTSFARYFYSLLRSCKRNPLTSNPSASTVRHGRPSRPSLHSSRDIDIAITSCEAEFRQKLCLSRSYTFRFLGRLISVSADLEHRTTCGKDAEHGRNQLGAYPGAAK